ncbi:nitrogen regulation protein NR(II) [Algoriphagus litoralis]|uniref:hypothetical protein n=1 Tax=Algoriphagus litoralis TaxID=2202829 RepID=UPI000DB94126|nr:hypothetical protein [Algoriphagus litoralis]
MESDHFFLLVTDVEGKVMRYNKGFERINPNPIGRQFSDFLSPNSEEEFDYSLDLMLGTPKIRRHLMLDHPSLQLGEFSHVWWEFSVLTTPDMDISGVFGIGVGMHFLEQDMPWDNLVDVLGFGEIILDTQFVIKSWDQKIVKWFDPLLENWLDSPVSEVFYYEGYNGLPHILSQISLGDRPKCFSLFLSKADKTEFAALVTMSHKGYHLFLMPKPCNFNNQPEKPLISSQVMKLFAGAVFVLNKSGILLQQNEDAKKLGTSWTGEPFPTGYFLNLPNSSKDFAKLSSAIEEAHNGKSTEFEFRNLISRKEFECWKVIVKPIQADISQLGGILIQFLDITALRSELAQLILEKERIKDLASIPSHILRGPLSSILGILELLDPSQLDSENQKLFSHLKPLAKELDHAIRQHSKRMSSLT